jgi:hypothetical protein
VVKRLRRFVDNENVRVREWYRSTAKKLLKAASVAGTVHLIIDGTKIGSGHTLVMVAVAYKGRALPIAWTWVCSEGHSTTRKQLALLDYVRQLIPEGTAVSLVGDCEFGRPLLLAYLQVWGWQYALREPRTYLCMTKGHPIWRHLEDFDLQPGTQIWVGNAVLTEESAQPTNLAFWWEKGQEEPRFLATNMPCAESAFRLYRRRMWIEEMFGDMKGHGFDLESTRLGQFMRLSRLTLAVCWLYVWLVSLGGHLIFTDQTDLVDRNDRRDLSIFRLGLDYVERLLALGDPIPLCHIPAFTKLSGG